MQHRYDGPLTDSSQRVLSFGKHAFRMQYEYFLTAFYVLGRSAGKPVSGSEMGIELEEGSTILTSVGTAPLPDGGDLTVYLVNIRRKFSASVIYFVRNS